MGSDLAGKRFDIIVVGSGVGGLVAGLVAARAGQNVLVVEAKKQLGGYCNPFKRGKYRFDPGVHYIGECGPGQLFHRLVDSLDLSSKLQFRELSPDGFERIVFPGYEITMPRGVDLYRERLLRDFPHERDGIDRFFDLLAQFRAAMKVIQKINGLPGAIDAVPHVPFLLRYGRATYAELLNPIIKDPLLRAVLAAQSGDYGLPPRRASALIGLGLVDHYIRGAYFPVGGSGAIRDALVDGIRAHGGTLVRNTPVERILLEGGAVTGIRTAAGEHIHARTVISNADAAHTYSTLIGEEHLSFLLRRKVQKNHLSVASICLFLGTDLDLTQHGMTDANIWSYPTTDLDRFYDPIYEGKMPDQDFFFLSSPSLKDPGHGLPGKDSLELVTLAPFEPFARWEGGKSMRRGEEYESLKQSLYDRYIRAAERFIPGLSSHIQVAEVATPVTNVTYATSPQGAIYGPEATPDQMGPFRFGIKGAFDGLYFCGAAVHGGGVVPAALSGAQAARAAVKWSESVRPLRAPVPAPAGA
ncbi:MAG: NAD(P)/FAD-dependent oxidoreductase [Polyangiaceae bacterium]